MFLLGLYEPDQEDPGKISLEGKPASRCDPVFGTGSPRAHRDREGGTPAGSLPLHPVAGHPGALRPDCAAGAGGCTRGSLVRPEQRDG